MSDARTQILAYIDYRATGKIDRLYMVSEINPMPEATNRMQITMAQAATLQMPGYPTEFQMMVQDGDLIARVALTGFTASSTNITADGIAEFTVTGLAAGTTVRLDMGAPRAVTDGEVVFSTTDPGEHLVMIETWPALPAFFTVTAT